MASTGGAATDPTAVSTPAPTSRIEALAENILKNVNVFNSYLHKNNLPQPSFAVDGPLNINTSDQSIEKARSAAMEDVLELHDLLLGPKNILRPQWNAVSLQAIYRYDLASLVPLQGDISFADLSNQSGLYEPDLKRILRYAMIYHRAFTEPRKGYVAHTAASRVIAEDENSRNALGLMFDENFQSYAKTVDAIQKWGDQSVNHTGFALAHGIDSTYFQYLRANPEKQKRFAGAMAAFGDGGEDISPSFLATKYAWDKFGSGTLVDVGGATGSVSLVVAEHHPELNFIIQDMPQVIESAEKQELKHDIASRFKFQAHDFFTPQTVAAEAYLFRYVLHNWPDRYAIDILQQTRPVLKEGSRIIINDSVLPEPNTASSTTEREVRSMDMLMLTLSNARERDLEDWQKLLQEADPKFHLLGHSIPEGASLAILEIIWTDDASRYESYLL